MAKKKEEEVAPAKEKKTKAKATKKTVKKVATKKTVTKKAAPKKKVAKKKVAKKTTKKAAPKKKEEAPPEEPKEAPTPKPVKEVPEIRAEEELPPPPPPEEEPPEPEPEEELPPPPPPEVEPPPPEEEKPAEVPPEEETPAEPVEAEAPEPEAEPPVEEEKVPEPEPEEKPPEPEPKEEIPVEEEPKKEEAPPKKEKKPPEGDVPLLYNRWDFTEVEVEDMGLRRYINLTPIYLPHTGAKHANKRFGREKVNIVERLINNTMRTERFTGKKSKAYSTVKKAFEIIEKKTKTNPIQVLVHALQNAAPREEITRLRFGGISVPRAVDIAPSRRLDIAMRNICKGAVASTHKNKKPIEACLASEILLAANEDITSFSISRKEELERVAVSAR
jgi:small subunit ribosomal protein S7